MTIYLKSDIKERAEAAAKLGPQYRNPYPPHDEAHDLFVKYFEIERTQLAHEDGIQISAAHSISNWLAQ